MNRTSRLLKTGGTAGFALALVGCMNMSGLSGSSSYACKAPEGVTCDSVSGTYANAAQNNLPSQRRRPIAAAVSGGMQASSPVASGSSAGAAAPSPMTEGIPPTAVSLRSAPRILRLWFKPWEDADHDLYDQGYVFVQVDAGQWQVEHVQRQIRDAYAPLKPPPRAAATGTKETGPLPATLKNLPRPVDGLFPGPSSLVAPAARGSNGGGDGGDNGNSNE
jgi:conjugal transfer pilus assembly protein TraV